MSAVSRIVNRVQALHRATGKEPNMLDVDRATWDELMRESNVSESGFHSVQVYGVWIVCLEPPRESHPLYR